MGDTVGANSITTGLVTATMAELGIVEPRHDADVRGGTASLVQLMTWLSPGFPIGAFAYSHGIESAVAERRIRDAETLFEWLAVLLRTGSGWNDLVLFAAAYRAAHEDDADALAEVTELGLAMGGSRERRDETRALGAAFAEASLPWQSGAMLDTPMPYPVAVATLAAEKDIPLEEGLVAFAHGFAANLVAVATRLVPLGQSDAVKVLNRLEPVVLSCAARAERSTLDDLGSAAILSEIAAMRHETLSTRLFRS